MEGDLLEPVLGPSDESESDLDLEAVQQLPSKGPKQTRAKSLALNDPVHLRATLGKKCRCKKKNCFETFTPTERFQSWLAFRNEFVSMHKVDQDRIETCIEFQ